MDASYHRATALEDLSETAGHVVEVAGVSVLLGLARGEPRAVVNRCTHMGSALTGGRLRRGAVACPDHGAIFDLATGACAGGVGYPPLEVLSLRVVDGWVEVAVPSPR
jgi:nitrite reductase/ring-hydroxylating ferredoxin subunit